MKKLSGLAAVLAILFLATTAASPGCDCDCNAHARPAAAVPAAK